MKLSLKILLGILIPSILIVFIISYILIDKYTSNIVNMEISRSFQEFNNINTTIYNTYENRSNSYSYSDTLADLIETMAPYYEKKGILISYYDSNNKLYSNDKYLDNPYELLDVEYGYYNSLIKKIDGQHYLFISIGSADDVVIYSKNITSVYDSRKEIINITIITSFILILVIILISYIISKTLTKPLIKIEKEMTKLSNGDYDIKLKEGSDEIGVLAHNFNIMASEIKIRNDELLELIDNKQIFIDNLSHEMNTPLTSIYGYIELMEKVNLDDDRKYKALDYMKKETKRIIEMQKKLLMLSYKEKTNIDKVEIRLDGIFEQLKEELKEKVNSKNINLMFENNNDNIIGDELLISIAISNLIRNAINNSENDTSIIVKSYNDDSYNYISVKDEGCGISKEDIKKIIEPFYRVDKARSRKDGGAGLGLSIVKKIIELHNGELIIESELGVGSSFIIKIPR